MLAHKENLIVKNLWLDAIPGEIFLTDLISKLPLYENIISKVSLKYKENFKQLENGFC